MKLVTDRTEIDVFLHNAKGSYGIADLNRVESAVQEVLEIANFLKIDISLETKTDWALPGLFSVDEWNTEEQMSRYLRNVEKLCDAVQVHRKDLPQSMNFLDVHGANAIERAIERAHARLMAIINDYRYSGELYSGEETVL